MDLSSHNANPPGVFDGEPVPLSDVADTRIAESVAAFRRFVAEHGSLPTAESWTEAAMRPSEKTIRRRFGSFREAIQRVAPYLVSIEQDPHAAGRRPNGSQLGTQNPLPSVVSLASLKPFGLVRP